MRQVATHLRDELVRAVVAALSAQPARELHAQALAVEVHVAVQEVHLEEAHATPEGGLCAQRDDRVGSIEG